VDATDTTGNGATGFNVACGPCVPSSGRSVADRDAEFRRGSLWCNRGDFPISSSVGVDTDDGASALGAPVVEESMLSSFMASSLTALTPPEEGRLWRGDDVRTGSKAADAKTAATTGLSVKNGCSNSFEAVGRKAGSRFRHWSMKSRAFFDRCVGIYTLGSLDAIRIIIVAGFEASGHGG
jgi:hypothetical protein